MVQHKTDASWTESSGQPIPGAEAAESPGPFLADDVRLIAVENGLASIDTGRARATLDVKIGRTWDPALAGRYDLVAGRAPERGDEILVSPATLEALRLSVGDTIHGLDPVAEWTIVGVLKDSSVSDSDIRLFVSAGIVAPLPGDPWDRGAIWYVPEDPIDWNTVVELNRNGITALSRVVAAEHPDDFTSIQAQNASIALTLGALVAGFGALEVGLLAGAAFAVGARQEQQLLAIAATTGADPRQLARIVSTGGLVLGIIATGLAIPLGLGGAWAFMELTRNGIAAQYPGFHVPWPIVVAIALFAILVGWLSALVPARAAGRIEVLRALRGARRPLAPPRRVPVPGLILILLGVGLSIGGSTVSRLSRTPVGGGTAYNQGLDLLGVVIAVAGGVALVLGAVLCVSILLRASAALLRRVGPGARIASRDLLRNRGRSVPAIAASLVAAFVFGTIASAITLTTAGNTANYTWTLGLDQARLSLAETDFERRDIRWIDAEEIDGAVTALEQSLPVQELRVLQGVEEANSFELISAHSAGGDLPQLEVPQHSICPLERIDWPNGSTQWQAPTPETLGDADPRCLDNAGLLSFYTFGIPKIWIGSAEDVELATGTTLDAEARAAFERGEAFAVFPAYLGTDDRIQISWYTDPGTFIDPSTKLEATRTEQVPARLLPVTEHAVNYGVFLPRSTALDLGLEPRPMAVLAQLERNPTQAEQFEVARALPLAMGTGWADLRIETGPTGDDPLPSWILLAVAATVTLAAALAALGLARVEGRADDATLSAIGASRAIRRRIAFVQAVLVVGIGGLVGGALSLIPGFAIAVGVEAAGAFTPPWWQLGVLVIGLPLLAGVVSFVVTRSAPTIRGRTAIA